MADRTAILKLIEQSGNNFHYAVVRFLRAKEWTVSVSPYYSDYVTDQSREVDIIAERSYPVYRSPFNQFVGMINIRLFIECKHINGEIAFWFDNKNKANAIARITSDTPLTQDNTHTQKHHYLMDERVAKLFSKKLGSDQDVIYKALTQVLHAIIYDNEYHIPSMLLPHRRKILAHLDYPVIICHSFENFYQVYEDGKDFSRISRNFQLEVNYAYLSRAGNSKLDYFLIDMVDFNKMENFLALLEEADIGAIAEISHPALWA
jgi:hypothetical protein